MRSPPAVRASSTSMTSGGRSIRASASAATGENSRSVSSAFASPCSRMNAMAAGSSRTLMVLSTAPSIGTPKLAS